MSNRIHKYIYICCGYYQKNKPHELRVNDGCLRRTADNIDTLISTIVGKKIIRFSGFILFQERHVSPGGLPRRIIIYDTKAEARAYLDLLVGGAETFFPSNIPQFKGIS